MRTAALTLSTLVALVTPTLAQDWASAVGFSGGPLLDYCGPNITGAAVTKDAASSECINATTNCFAAKGFAHYGPGPDGCFIHTWDAAGCPEDGETAIIQIGNDKETIHGFPGSESFKLVCGIPYE